jgi:8-oxo-dGTP pyrophosphatase MutT (NUDIX family)
LWRACEPHASEPLPVGRLPVLVDGRRCGWVEPRTAGVLVEPPSPFTLRDARLTLLTDPAEPQHVSQSLHLAARRLHEAGIARDWRSEQLDVRTEDDRVVGRIERAACRPLGIETRSVQLNGLRPDGSLLVARRAAHKASDPNRWDSLTGGMIAAGEQDHEALAREADEEAGLQLTGLPLARGSKFRVRRRVPEGWMDEMVQVFDVQLPPDFTPVNRDGEVAGFAVITVESALDAIERGDFTLQASMAILDALRRSGTNLFTKLMKEPTNTLSDGIDGEQGEGP